MKAIELSLYFDDYERCSFNGTVVSFTDTDGHTLSLPVHTLTHMYNFAQFELARRGEAAAELRRLHAQQPAAVDEVKEPDLWRCTVCGRLGTVGRCCGEETREPVSHAVLPEENSND